LDDHDVNELIEDGIRRGSLVAVKKVDPTVLANRPVDPAVAKLRLIREIEAKTGGKLNESGRQYRLIRDIDFEKFPERNYYHVVRQDEAKQVLDAMAKQPGTSAELTELFTKARDQLTRDWNSFRDPDGLILLRRIPVNRAPVKDTGPAITPSQLRKFMEQGALDIHVVNLDREPQEGLAYRIKAPDGNMATGKLDKQGHAQVKSAVPGIFTVAFPDLDGADWDGDGALDLPKEERSEASKYKVEQGDRLPTIAREKGFARWQTVWDFAGNAALKKLRADAHILFPDDEVSIPTKLSRVAEVPGGKAEYVVQSATEVFHVRFAEMEAMDGDPVMFRATPDAGGDLFEGELADDGAMEIDLPPDTTQVTVELFCGDGDDPFVTYTFAVGELDPFTETTGIQARLASLGYYDGEIDGDLGDVSKGAIVRFRSEYGLPLSDEVDDDLKDALEWVHDADDDTGDCEADHTTSDGTEGGSADEPSDEGEDTDDEVPVDWDDGEDTGDDSQEENSDESDAEAGDEDDDDSGEVTP
jgi:hypothetical protein